MSPGCVRGGPRDVGAALARGWWVESGLPGPPPGCGAALRRAGGGRGRRAVRSRRQPLPASLRCLRSPDAGAGILETRGSGGAR